MNLHDPSSERKRNLGLGFHLAAKAKAEADPSLRNDKQMGKVQVVRSDRASHLRKGARACHPWSWGLGRRAGYDKDEVQEFFAALRMT